SELLELAGAKRRFFCRKELIELRRLDARARQHGVRLPAMMDIMLKQMHEQPIAPLTLHFRAAVDLHDVIEASARQRVADRYQAPVDRGLSRHQLCERGTRNRICPSLRPKPAALQCVDIKKVDDVNVIQRRLQARKEAGPYRLELRLVES